MRLMINSSLCICWYGQITFSYPTFAYYVINCFIFATICNSFAYYNYLTQHFTPVSTGGSFKGGWVTAYLPGSRRTLLSILADFNNAVVWMVSIFLLISNFSIPLFKSLGKVPSLWGYQPHLISSSQCFTDFFFQLSKFLRRTLMIFISRTYSVMVIGIGSLSF